MNDTAFFFSSFSSSVPAGFTNFTFKVTSRMVVTIMIKNKNEKIKSGRDAVFISGISRVPLAMISFLHNF